MRNNFEQPTPPEDDDEEPKKQEGVQETDDETAESNPEQPDEGEFELRDPDDMGDTTNGISVVKAEDYFLKNLSKEAQEQIQKLSENEEKEDPQQEPQDSTKEDS